MGIDKIYLTNYVFAAVLEDTPVATWSDKHSGGDSSTLKKTLMEVNSLTLVALFFFT